MTPLDAHMLVRAAETGSEPATALQDAVVAAVLARAERRLAWLDGPGGDGVGADAPAAEAAWRGSTAAARDLSTGVEATDAALLRAGERLDALCRTFMLGDVDRDLLLTALALRFEPALAGVFQRLTGRPWATEALAQRLFDHGRRPMWRPAGALSAWDIVREADAPPGEPPPLAVAPSVVAWLAGEDWPGAALAGCSRRLSAPDAPLADWPVAEVVRMIETLWRDQRPARLIVRGGVGSGRASFAATVIERLGHAARGVRSPADAVEASRIWTAAQRHALLTGEAMVWRRAAPAHPGRIPPAPLNAVTLALDDAIAVDAAAVDVETTLPPLDREACQALLARAAPASVAWPEPARRRLLDRSGLTLSDFAALARAPDAGAAEVEARARAAAARRLGDLAQRIDAPFEWPDLILPPVLEDGLRDLAHEAGTRKAFWERPDVRRLFERGRGLAVLFSGPPGSGKTMAAQVIARDLGVDVFRIDLASITSKYIGETARNLRDLFRRAADVDAVLLFDEADALFANRTEVKDSRDRYANADTGYLLQQLEDFEGVAILSTNRKANIDSAFLRRLRYVFDFPRPDRAERRRLWRALAPAILGLTSDADMRPTFDRLADALDLTGAQIKSALLAARFAAERRGAAPPGTVDLVKGVERELAKEGRTVSAADRRRLTADD